MFFHIGKNCPLLTEVTSGLFLDRGWSFVKINDIQVWFKGYSIECRLNESIPKILEGYKPRGIWCVISCGAGQYKLMHPELRGFPLYERDDEITNLPITGFSWNNAALEIPRFQQQEFDKVAEQIKNRVVQNCLDFVKYNDSELNLWCTGGIDSTSILAVLEYAKIPYNLYVASPRSEFVNPIQFEGSIQEYSSPLLSFCRDKFWGYALLSVFNNRTTLVSGFYGDEFLARGPRQIKYISDINGRNPSEPYNQDDYMQTYLSRKKNTPIMSTPIENISEIDAKHAVYLSVINDYQMWNFDNVIVFSPYYDLMILELVLNLPSDLLLRCVMDATMQKRIIELTTPKVLKLVDSHKNTLRGRENLLQHLNDTKLQYCKNVHIV